jgi:hypothetical protein
MFADKQGNPQAEQSVWGFLFATVYLTAETQRAQRKA